MKNIRIILGVLLAIAGVVMLFTAIASVVQWTHITAYALGGLTSSLLMALLAFALAWECFKKRI